MKNFISKIKAIFNVGGKGFVLDLKSAEIKQNKAFLHPVDNDNITYMVRAEHVDILLNNGEEISEDDFIVIEKGKEGTTEIEDDTSSEQNDKEKLKSPEITPRPKPQGSTAFSLGRKTTIRFTVYEDEGRKINEMIRGSGMKRADYLMACLQNSQKKSNIKSFNAECMRVKKERESREKDIREQMKKAQ